MLDKTWAPENDLSSSQDNFYQRLYKLRLLLYSTTYDSQLMRKTILNTKLKIVNNEVILAL